MKTLPIFMTESMLKNKIKIRNSKMVKELIQVSGNIPSESANIINNFGLHLARFARKNNCKFSFMFDETNGLSANVLKEHFHYYPGFYSFEPEEYITPGLYQSYKNIGKVNLGKDVETTNFFGKIKQKLKTLIDEHKNDKNITRHLFD